MWVFVWYCGAYSTEKPKAKSRRRMPWRFFVVMFTRSTAHTQQAYHTTPYVEQQQYIRIFARARAPTLKIMLGVHQKKPIHLVRHAPGACARFSSTCSRYVASRHGMDERLRQMGRNCSRAVVVRAQTRACKRALRASVRAMRATDIVRHTSEAHAKEHKIFLFLSLFLSCSFFHSLTVKQQPNSETNTLYTILYMV